MSYQRCCLCQKKGVKPIYRTNNRTIYRCLNDDLFFSSDEEKIEKNLYSNDYYESSPYDQPELFNNIYFQSKLNKIITLTGETKPNILDVGCGWGNFLEILKNKDIPYLGVDLASSSIKICREKNLNVQKEDLIKISKTKKQDYSAITFFQLLEHLKRPLEYLEAAKKLVKKNGVILITTPNNDSPFRRLLGPNWPVYNTPSHYFFYSKNSLQRLLEMAGFNNFKIKIDRFRFFSSNYVLQRIFKKKLSSYKIFNFPVPTDPWGDLEAIVLNNK